MENIEVKLSELDTKIDKLINANEKIAESLDIIASDLKHLRGKSKATMETVDGRLDEILGELRKINHITNYEDQHKNLPNQPLN